MNKKVLCIVALISVMLFVLGCSAITRKAYSPQKAEELFIQYQPELEEAALWMQENPNVWFVVKGKDSQWDPSRVYTKIDDYAVFSNEPLTQQEADGIKQKVLPVFADPELESVRRYPVGFATYISFFHVDPFPTTIFDLYKEIERNEKGELRDLRYCTYQKDLGDGWYIIDME